MTQRQLIGGTVTVMAVVVLTGVLIWFVHETVDVLLLLLVSAVLATGFAPLVGALENWRLPGGVRPARGVAIAIVYLALLIAGTVISAIIVVPAVAETRKLVDQGPQLLMQAQGRLAALRVHRAWIPDVTAALNHFANQNSTPAVVGSGAALVALRLATGVLAAITVLVVTFYMLLEGAAIKTAFVTVFPREQRPRMGLILHRIGLKFGGWLRGQLLLALLVAGLVAVALLGLGISYPFLIGAIAGLGELIPLVGLTLAAVVAVLVTLGHPLWQLLAVAAFFVVAIQLESHVLIPRLMARALGVSPLLTIVALLFGVKLMGVLGALLALPLAAAVQVIVREVVDEIKVPPVSVAVTGSDAEPAAGSATAADEPVALASA